MNLVREKRGSATWDGSWRNQTLASISPPPFPLIAVFFIIISLLYYRSNNNNNNNQALTNLKLFLVLLPVIIILVAHFLSKLERFANPQMTPDYYGGEVAQQQQRRWELPWGLLVMLAFLLLMLSFHPSFH
ncbi:hypothetical protein LINGRAHAP2_LOCUS24164 [Linum grandiflorum]